MKTALRYLRYGFTCIVANGLFFGVVAQPVFTEVASSRGITFMYGPGEPSGGVSFADFNQDGRDDITLAAGAGRNLAFYANTGSGFALLQPAPVSLTQESKQVLWVDYDNDGDKDLYVSTVGARNYLFRNEGSLVMTDVTASAGLPMQAEPSYGAAWGDFDRDGWLDLIVTAKKIGLESIVSTNRLFRNRGDGTFDDVTRSAGLQDDVRSPFCVSFIDFDNDLWPDIYVAQDKRAVNNLFVNRHNGTFLDRAPQCNAAISMFGMSVSSADVDGNGMEEIYITNTVGNKLLMNHGQGFTEESHVRGVDFIGGYGWGASFLDAENDGDADLYVSGSLTGSKVVSSLFYLNDGKGKFAEAHGGFGADTLSSYSNAVGDVDDDGFMDILVSNSGGYPMQLWRNGGGAGSWIKIKLVGTLSNRDGIGAWIEVFAGGRQQRHFTKTGVSYLGQNSDWVHFGLGASAVIDSIRVWWPSGHMDRLTSVNARQKLNLEEGSTRIITPRLSHSGIVQRCAGDSVVLNAGLFGTALTYLWSTGATTPELVVKTSGTYSVSVQSVSRSLDWVSSAIDVQFSGNLQPVAEAAVFPPSCFGSDDGRVDLMLSGGTEPYSIIWSTGDTGVSLLDITTGVYSAQVVDGRGCNLSLYVSVEEPEPFLLEHQIFEISFGQYAIQLTKYGGVLPIDYAWNVPGAPNKANLTNLDPGDYSVIATDAAGCTVSRTITIDEPETITSVRTEGNSMVVFPNPVSDQLLMRRKNTEAACYRLVAVSPLGLQRYAESCLEAGERDWIVPGSLFFPGWNRVLIFRDGTLVHQVSLVAR